MVIELSNSNNEISVFNEAKAIIKQFELEYIYFNILGINTGISST